MTKSAPQAKIMNWIAGIMSSLVVLGIVALFRMSNEVAELRVQVTNMITNLEMNQRENMRRLERLEDWQRATIARERGMTP